eukprot:1190355-Prorocentrum_minimum.AAC.4
MPNRHHPQGLYWYANSLEQDDDGNVADAFYVEKPPAIVWVSLKAKGFSGKPPHNQTEHVKNNCI